MASIGFILNILIYRNAQRKGESYKLKYPVNPKQLEKMGAPFMTKALRASGKLEKDIQVETVSISIPGQVGLLGQLRIVELTYSKKTDAPKAMMVKFASSDLKTRSLTALFGFTKSEYKFYSGKMAQDLPFRTPKVYYADMNMWTGNCCLMMEYIVGGEFQDVLKGNLTLGDAKLMVGSLAQLHALYIGPNINKSEIKFIPLLNESQLPKLAHKASKDAYKMVLNKQQPGNANQNWDYEFPVEFTKYADDMFDHLVLYWDHSSSWPTTLGVIHGDARTDNFWFYNDETGNRTCGLLDWQLMFKQCVMADICWLVLGSCTPEFQRDHIDAILDHYFTELAKAGGPNVEAGTEDRAMWEELFDVEMYVIVIKSIIGCADIDPSQPRVIPQMNMQMRNNFEAIRLRKSDQAWEKFRHGKLIVQKRFPEISEKLFKKHKAEFKRLEGATYDLNPEEQQ